MNFLDEIFKNKHLKSSEKLANICKAIIDKEIDLENLINFASASNDPIKGTCIEAMEHVTLKQPQFATLQSWEFAVDQLKSKAPRVKWESARFIGNVAHLFPSRLEKAISGLLTNSEHVGTVVRWSSAFAISKIMDIDSPNNSLLSQAIQAIIEREKKNSIRKIYILALKKYQNQT